MRLKTLTYRRQMVQSEENMIPHSQPSFRTPVNVYHEVHIPAPSSPSSSYYAGLGQDSHTMSLPTEIERTEIARLIQEFRNYNHMAANHRERLFTLLKSAKDPSIQWQPKKAWPLLAEAIRIARQLNEPYALFAAHLSAAQAPRFPDQVICANIALDLATTSGNAQWMYAAHLAAANIPKMINDKFHASRAIELAVGDHQLLEALLAAMRIPDPETQKIVAKAALEVAERIQDKSCLYRVNLQAAKIPGFEHEITCAYKAIELAESPNRLVNALLTAVRIRKIPVHDRGTLLTRAITVAAEHNNFRFLHEARMLASKINGCQDQLEAANRAIATV